MLTWVKLFKLKIKNDLNQKRCISHSIQIKVFYISRNTMKTVKSKWKRLLTLCSFKVHFYVKSTYKALNKLIDSPSKLNR